MKKKKKKISKKKPTKNKNKKKFKLKKNKSSVKRKKKIISKKNVRKKITKFSKFYKNKETFILKIVRIQNSLTNFPKINYPFFSNLELFSGIEKIVSYKVLREEETKVLSKIRNRGKTN